MSHYSQLGSLFMVQQSSQALWLSLYFSEMGFLSKSKYFILWVFENHYSEKNPIGLCTTKIGGHSTKIEKETGDRRGNVVGVGIVPEHQKGEFR